MNSTLGAECSGSSRSRSVCSLPPPACSFRLMTDGEACSGGFSLAAVRAWPGYPPPCPGEGGGETAGGDGDESEVAFVARRWAGATAVSEAAAAPWPTRYGGGDGGDGCERCVA